MLYAFMQAHRAEIIRRTRMQRETRSSLPPSADEITMGIPLFVDELTAVVGAFAADSKPAESMARSAGETGERMLRNGFTIGQVVHGYGDVCQAVARTVDAVGATLGGDDYRVLNQALDDAIAAAVSSFEAARASTAVAQEAERLGFLAHEMRNTLTSALISLDAVRSGRVPTRGKVSDVLHTSLLRLRNLVDRSVADVRLLAGTSEAIVERIRLVDLIDEVEAGAAGQAAGRDQALLIKLDPKLYVRTDRQLFISALSNLVLNGLKYSPKGSMLSLVARGTGDLVMIDVVDACGGVEDELARSMFEPFVRGATSAEGLGLGLSIVKRAMSASGGTVAWRNDPPRGCAFTLSLPAAPT